MTTKECSALLNKRVDVPLSEKGVEKLSPAPPKIKLYELYDGYDFPKNSPYGFCGALTKY